MSFQGQSLARLEQIAGQLIESSRHTRTADAAERVRQIVLEGESGVPVANPGYGRVRVGPSYARGGDAVWPADRTIAALPPSPDPCRPFAGPTTTRPVD